MGKYTVKSGESWASIAGKLYGGDQRYFNVLMAANRGVGMLQPGMVIDAPDLTSYINQNRAEGKRHYVGPDDIALANLYNRASGYDAQLPFSEGTAPSPWLQYQLQQAGLATGGAATGAAGGYTVTPKTRIEDGQTVPVVPGDYPVTGAVPLEEGGRTYDYPYKPVTPRPRSPRATGSPYTRSAATEGTPTLTWQARRAAGMTFTPPSAGYRNVSPALRRATAGGAPTSIYNFASRGYYSGRTRQPGLKFGRSGRNQTSPPARHYPQASYTNYGSYDVVRDVRDAATFEPNVSRQALEPGPLQVPLWYGRSVPEINAYEASFSRGGGPRERNTRGTGRTYMWESGTYPRRGLEPPTGPTGYRPEATQNILSTGNGRSQRDNLMDIEAGFMGGVATTKRVEGYAPVFARDEKGNVITQYDPTYDREMPVITGWEPVYTDTDIQTPIRGTKQPSFLSYHPDGTRVIQGGEGYVDLDVQSYDYVPVRRVGNAPNGTGNYGPFEWRPTGGGGRTYGPYNRPIVKGPSGNRVAPASQYQRPASRGGVAGAPRATPITRRDPSYNAFIGAVNWRLF